MHDEEHEHAEELHDARRKSHDNAVARKSAYRSANLGIGAAAGGIGGGLAAVGGGIASAARGVHNNKARIFLLVILGFHFFDMLSGYNRIGGNSVWWAVWYLLFALVLAPFFLDEGNGYVHALLSKKTFIFVVVSAIAWILPVVIDKVLPAAVQESHWFVFLLMISPPWLIYMMLAGIDDPLINKIRIWWVLIWVGLALVLLFSSISQWNAPAQLQGQFSFDPLEVLKDVGHDVKTAFKKTFERLTGVPATFGSFVNRNLNDSIGRSFTGQVDPYAQGDLGVQFTQVRVFQDEFRPGDEVIVWADLQGESFNEEINLVMNCYAIDGDKRIYNGTVVTQNSESNNLQIKMREKASASCTFSSLPKGYYEVVFSGVFVFETWAYIQYYFAPDELVKNMWQQDINPAREAGIMERPIAIYTSGPVNLGLASEYDQPIPVDPYPNNSLSPDRTLPPFGASITNQWADGKVLSVRQITLMVPDPFILKNCDRVPQSGTKDRPDGTNRSIDMPGYTLYTFGNIGAGSGGSERVNSGFESVTCFLGFGGNPSASAASVVGSYDLVMKTFAAKTNYLYMIQDSIQVKVDDFNRYR